MTQRVASVLGVGGFRDSTNYFEAALEGEQLFNASPLGSNTMTRLVVMQVVKTPSASVTERVWGNDNANTRGWQVQWTIAALGWRWRVGTTGGGGQVTVDVPMNEALMRVGTILVYQSSFNSVTGAALRVNSTTGTAAPNGDYVAAVRNTTIGVVPNAYNLPCVSFGVVAAFATDLVSVSPTAAIESFVAERVANGRDLSGLSALWDSPSDFLYYDARDVVIDGSAVEASWSPRVGPSIPLTTNGRPMAFDTPGRLLT